MNVKIGKRRSSFFGGCAAVRAADGLEERAPVGAVLPVDGQAFGEQVERVQLGGGVVQGTAASRACRARGLPYPEAVTDTSLRRERCAGPGCDRELDHASTGRPRRYCGAACRQRARRTTRTDQTPPDNRANDLAEDAAEDALQAALPPDTRPAPSVAAYDNLLQRRPAR